MHPFPHHYQVTAKGSPQGDVMLATADTPDIATQAPAGFGGPGGRWSPESLLTAAVADCFVLGVRAIGGASKFEFNALDVKVEGTLDQVDKVMKFTDMHITAELSIPEGSDAGKAERFLAMAEKSCLITNSMNVNCHLSSKVTVA